MVTQTLDNVTFLSPSVGVALTVNFIKGDSDINTTTTKYMPLSMCKNILIRSDKIFKVTKINGYTLTDPMTSSTTNPTVRLDQHNGDITYMSITFEPDEASGEFQVTATSAATNVL